MAGNSVKEEEFTRAVCLGLFDYVRKSRSRGFVVSLSGGCDSASVVALIGTMVKLASAELGHEETVKRLGSFLSDDPPADFETLLPRICLLYTSPSPRDKRQSRMPSSA